jgi:hypothetical protein
LPSNAAGTWPRLSVDELLKDAPFYEDPEGHP